jgi:hypothetical protein
MTRNELMLRAVWGEKEGIQNREWEIGDEKCLAATAIQKAVSDHGCQSIGRVVGHHGASMS